MMTWLIQAVLLNAMLAGMLAFAAWLIGRNGRRPALAHAVWVLVLVKLVTPPLVRWPVELDVDHGGVIASVLERSEAEAANPESPPSLRPAAESVAASPGRVPAAAVEPRETSDWKPAVTQPIPLPNPGSVAAPSRDETAWVRPAVWGALGIWLAGAVALGTTCYRRLRRFSTTLRVATAADAELDRRAAMLARGLGLSRSPAVVTLDGPISPLLWGFGRRATIVLPTLLWERLSPGEQDAVLVHELAHFARRDHLVRVLELIVTVLFWWNPVVWWARRHIETTEEQCCDAWVVGQLPAGPRTYAEALLTTIDFISEHRVVLPPAASGVTDISAIERRLKQIMCERVPRSLSSPLRGVVLGLTVLLPLQPLLLAAPSRIVNDLTSPLTSWTSETRPLSERSSVPADAPQGTAGGTEVGLPPVDPDSAVLQSPIFQTGPTSSRPAVAVSPDGRYRLVSQGTGRVIFEEPSAGRQVDLTEFQITTARFFPDSEHFVAGLADGRLRVWSCADVATESALGGHRARVQSLDVSSDARQIVSSDRDGRLLLFRLNGVDAVSLEPISLSGPVQPVTALRFSPDGRVIAAAVGDPLGRTEHYIELLNVATQTSLGRLEADAPIASLDFAAPDRLLGVDGQGRVTVWNPLRRYVIDHGVLSRDDVAAATFSPDAHAFDRMQPEYAVQLPESPREGVPSLPAR